MGMTQVWLFECDAAEGCPNSMQIKAAKPRSARYEARLRGWVSRTAPAADGGLEWFCTIHKADGAQVAVSRSGRAVDMVRLGVVADGML